MNTTKILPSEITQLKVASLPSRPTASADVGGRGYTATQMKEAFDRLPLFIIERLNDLIDELSRITGIDGGTPHSRARKGTGL